MLFGDVIAIALSIIGFLMSLQGLWLVSHALWPQRVEITTRHCAGGGLKCFLLGLPVTLLGVLFAAIAARRGTFGQVTAFSAALLYIVYANIGVAGFVTHIGRRLASPADAERPWKATIRGGTALELAWLIPILGWLGLLPITLILGAGAMTLSLFSSARKPVSDPAWAPLPAPAPLAVPPPALPFRVTESDPTAPASDGSALPSKVAVVAPPLPKAQRPRPIAETRELEPAEPAGVE